ncbi:hypothetical protein GALMADRAFT_1364685 [Galerina marginata CBS 339.88]|uniref:Aminoacyl-tRNA synthetase class Ia domain-containing protein n=1 Tax=Galerina marginata (strain CBS 339.88) TaxID=685588 RepID=A0A067TF54_GALM3|nr:hypothetical protein GALMADRAFT_1364685 [Galerina marginata CBS 339.88]
MCTSAAQTHTKSQRGLCEWFNVDGNQGQRAGNGCFSRLDPPPPSTSTSSNVVFPVDVKSQFTSEVVEVIGVGHAEKLVGKESLGMEKKSYGHVAEGSQQCGEEQCITLVRQSQPYKNDALYALKHVSFFPEFSRNPSKPSFARVSNGVSLVNASGKVKTWEKGQDTMDVWFDGGIPWLMLAEVNVGRDRADAAAFSTDSDQHRGWFHGQLLTAVTSKPAGEAAVCPYAALIPHGMVLDEKGKKMSNR